MSYSVSLCFKLQVLSHLGFESLGMNFFSRYRNDLGVVIRFEDLLFKLDAVSFCSVG